MRNKLALINMGLVTRKPLFFIRAALRLFSQKYLGGDSLIGVDFAIHYECNMRCRHCYESSFRANSNPLLSLEEQKAAIIQCLDLGALAVDFVGGETTINENFPELVKSCRPATTYISLATNAFNLSEEQLKYYLKIGVDKINISLDSWNPEEHDFNRRKKGSHKKALEVVEICKRIGLDVTLTIVVANGDTQTENFQSLIDYAIKENTRIFFKTAVPVGEWAGAFDKLISDQDRETMEKLHEKHPNLTRDTHEGCPAFQRQIFITAHGDILPCTAVHVAFGNVRDQSIKDILAKGRGNPYFDGKFKGCHPGETRDFIEKYLTKTYSAQPYPPKSEDVFDDLP